MARSLAATWAVLPCLAAGCGDVELRSVPPPRGVPAALEGEWNGSWQSLVTSENGAIQITVQEFQLQPVVSLDTTNASLAAIGEAEFVLSGRGIELRRQNTVILTGNLQADRRILGSYSIAGDHGTWFVQWHRELPPLLDLSGSWTGKLAAVGTGERPLAAQLTQSLVGSALVIQGTLLLPDLLLAPLPVSGFVRFRDREFDLMLSTDGAQPHLLLSGIGDRQPLQVDIGFLQVLSNSGLPFSQGTFHLRPDDR